SNVVSGVFSWRRGSESNRRIKVLQTFTLPGQGLPSQKEIQGREKSVRLWSGSIWRLDLSFVIVQLKTLGCVELGRGLNTDSLTTNPNDGQPGAARCKGTRRLRNSVLHRNAGSATV